MTDMKHSLDKLKKNQILNKKQQLEKNFWKLQNK